MLPTLRVFYALFFVHYVPVPTPADYAINCATILCGSLDNISDKASLVPRPRTKSWAGPGSEAKIKLLGLELMN